MYMSFKQVKKLVLENVFFQLKDLRINDNVISFKVAIQYSIKEKDGSYSNIPEYLKCVIFSTNKIARDEFEANLEFLQNDKVRPLLNITGIEKREKYTNKENQIITNPVLYIDTLEISNNEIKPKKQYLDNELEDDEIPF